MSRSRKTNRDHAKKQQRPMIEDKVIAEQLEDLLLPAITSQENYYRQLGPPRPHPQFAVDGSCSVNPTMARCGRSQRIDSNLSKSWIFVV